ncbi:MAG: hypothetical protein QHG99_08875 [Methanomicrobiales archaeon]|nr:hypothetical protein [Methanomicrobiales archaeon]
MKKPKMVKTGIDERIVDLAERTEHLKLAIWAADCAERVLPYFEREHSTDDRPRRAIEALREWIRSGRFRMAEIRGTALAAHAAAREAGRDDAARSAARATGQAVATAHAPRHAIAAAIYAATAVRDATDSSDAGAAALEERLWQYRHLIELNEEVAN